MSRRLFKILTSASFLLWVGCAAMMLFGAWSRFYLLGSDSASDYVIKTVILSCLPCIWVVDRALGSVTRDEGAEAN